MKTKTLKINTISRCIAYYIIEKNIIDRIILEYHNCWYNIIILIRLDNVGFWEPYCRYMKNLKLLSCDMFWWFELTCDYKWC